MDRIFEVHFMYPVTGAVQVEVQYVWAHDALEAIIAVEAIDCKMIRPDEFHFLEILKHEDEEDIDAIPRKKWEKRLPDLISRRPDVDTEDQTPRGIRRLATRIVEWTRLLQKGG